MGGETWSLTVMEERRLEVFENRVLRGITGPKRKWWKAGENCIMSFITSTLHHI
jgi:hypothetical protein